MATASVAFLFRTMFLCTSGSYFLAENKIANVLGATENFFNKISNFVVRLKSECRNRGLSMVTASLEFLFNLEQSFFGFQVVIS